MFKLEQRDHNGSGTQHRLVMDYNDRLVIVWLDTKPTQRQIRKFVKVGKHIASKGRGFCGGYSYDQLMQQYQDCYRDRY